ncbi:MAG: hypothetical protein JXR77_14430, partial [Lentisphaeria bacterium]|nr:hypothetical protein [Lentisphaeria bacterium]
VLLWGPGNLPPALGDLPILAVHDCLGRDTDRGRLAALNDEPLFLILPEGAAANAPLEPALTGSPPRPDRPAEVVLQAEFPLATRNLSRQAHQIVAGQPVTVPIYTYNFGPRNCTGEVAFANLPAGWKVTPATWSATLAPMERHRQDVILSPPTSGRDILRGIPLTCRGDFGPAGTAHLQFRLVADPTGIVPTEQRPIRSALRADAWTDNIVEGATLTHQREEPRGMRFTMTFGDADPWSYPYVTLDPEDIPSGRMHGLAFTIQVHEGSGVLRVQFAEEAGAGYIVDMHADAALRTPQKVLVAFDNANWGAWSKPDPDGQLRPEDIRRVLVGINSHRGTTVSYSVHDLAWVRLDP